MSKKPMTAFEEQYPVQARRIELLEEALAVLVGAVKNDTGAEPSVSVLGRACDKAKALLRI